MNFQWYGGDALCRICKFFHTFNFYLNSFVIAVIAVDRAQGAYRIKLVKFLPFPIFFFFLRSQLISSICWKILFSQHFVRWYIRNKELILLKINWKIETFVTIKSFHYDLFFFNIFAYCCSNIEASKLAFRWVKYMLASSYIAAIIFSVPQIFIFRVYQPNEDIEFR